MADLSNIARHLPLMAAQQPARIAIKIPRGRTPSGDIDYLSLSFAELDAEVDAWAHHLSGRGVARGDRVLVMVKQGLPLIAGAFALFKLGAVPVIIDPGMGIKSFLSCVARTQPRALLGIPLAQALSRVFRPSFRSVQVRVGVSGSTTARRRSQSADSKESRFQLAATRSDELAAILFTSGSTGAPKGVCYEHGMFEAQVQTVRDTYRIEPGEIDLPMLPIFALFNPALGMTTIVPEINPSRPASVDPAKIVQAIQQEKVTNSFGSPTLWKKISAHCLGEKITLPSLRRVLMAGAPVPPKLFADMKAVLSHGEPHSPYGATEALPVSTVSAMEILSDKNSAAEAAKSGAGTCVGRPVAGVKIKVIAAIDGPIASFDQAEELPPAQIGEIIVCGPAVTKKYDELAEATAGAKIKSLSSESASSAEVWHRMGDMGYVDAEGKLWFCGRKAERVKTIDRWLYTEQCEPVFAVHPKVKRCALIGVTVSGKPRAALVVEPRPPTRSERRQVARELREIGLKCSTTTDVNLFYFHDAFPVDVRHNAKIHRLTLARFFEDKPGIEIDKR